MTSTTDPDSERLSVRPLMKWAGGKRQLLPQLMAASPGGFHRYIEPFIGGGAMFFHLRPESAVIADSNLELINLYRAVAADPSGVFDATKSMANTEEFFYELRAIDWTILEPVHAAARTLFLNRTCFNGLYRVNRKGQFNVPFGRYAKLSIPDLEHLTSASEALKKSEIVEGDYLDVLNRYAGPGDFVFLDPPYLPVGQYSDFKRYTKEQFSEDDHRLLAQEVHRLVDIGCDVLLTNSNHPLVHELYKDYEISIIPTKRFINSKGNGRSGEDTIVSCMQGKRPR
jgi:DNA adenine methylase